MMRVSLTEIKNRLSHYLRLVKRGETIEVLEHQVPIARLTRVAPSPGDQDTLLQRLERDGIVCTPECKPYKGLLKVPPLPCSADAVQALIDERGSR